MYEMIEVFQEGVILAWGPRGATFETFEFTLVRLFQLLHFYEFHHICTKTTCSFELKFFSYLSEHDKNTFYF